MDADDVGIKEVRGVREWDTCFPYAIIDADKEKIQRQNPIFSYVAWRMFTKKPWTDGNGTIEDVRRIIREFYDEAGRE